MVVILSTSQIVQKTIELYRTSQPLLDTKPGTIARDLFIDSLAVRFSELYDELNRVTSAQSIARSIGSDLDQLVSNYGESRQEQGRAVGPVIFTFASILSDLVIPSGTIVYAKSGVSFRTLNTFTVRSSDESKYITVATKIQTDLDFLNITDPYAVEILAECSIAGTTGNISKYSIISTSVSGISSVTNVSAFAGGSPAESDAAYKSRIISVFSGSNTGTELGYASSISADPAVQSAIVIGPGDPLMVRDNTIIKLDAFGDPVLDSDGEPIILSEGDGGKVDIYVQGFRLTENIASVIYNDQSGQDNPTLSQNDYVIGQISGFENATLNKRRRLALKNKTMPSQPVYNIIEVVGSKSGVFTNKTVDQYGRITGNYELVKDTGAFSGSPFGFDKLHWINNFSALDSEDITKTLYNGQDQLSFTDLLKINNIRRVITVTNENSKVNVLDRSELQLTHNPIRNIIKVLNVTTGERYIVSNRNPDGSSGALNVTGRIYISGSSLPSVSDILQVDYEWMLYHDTYVDFDSKVTNDNIRSVVDSVDWGYSNAIRREECTVTSNKFITTSIPISSVVSVNYLQPVENCIVDSVDGKLKIFVNNVVTNVVSIKTSSGIEVYNTYVGNGYWDNKTIYFPTDSSVTAYETVEVYYNAKDIFTSNGVSGSFSDKTITLLSNTTATLVEVNYIANVPEFIPVTNLSSLPILQSGNAFRYTGSTTDYGNQPVIYTGIFPTKNLRKSPSKLAINFSGVVSPGVLLVKGTTSRLLENVVFTATVNGLVQDLTQAIKSGLGLTSSSSLPTGLKISRVIKMQVVEATSSNIVTAELNNYDVIGYKINDSTYCSDEGATDATISYTEVSFPVTASNLNNSPLAGQKMQVTLYVVVPEVTEEISVSTNGTMYTSNSFSRIETISIASGFQTNGVYAGAITVLSMNQPSSGNKYKISYDFTSPKPGERIDIRYNYNSLLSDSTVKLEPYRQITADILVKEAPYIMLDIVASIIVSKAYKSSSKLIMQNVADQIASVINGQKMGATLHASDLINAAYQVTGLDSIRITTFNKIGRIGQVLQIQSMRNQYLRANSVIITQE